MSRPVLDLRDVSHAYPDGTLALDRVSVSIPRGLYGLLGPNGAGKSTLMRIAATLLSPTGGTVYFCGIDALSEPERLRRTLGYLPQDFGVYPRVTAYEMLDHLAVLKGLRGAQERRETVEALLHRVNLWPDRRKALSGFSGGMRQRFGIAQALIANPTLVIVDEPTAGLDPEERIRFLDLLAEIGEEAVLILSTHLVEDVADLCPRMAVLADGRILLEGAPPALIAGLSGRIWMKAVGREELAACRERHEVIAARLAAGRRIVHILSDGDPGEGFTAVAGGLGDLYLATLAQARRAA